MTWRPAQRVVLLATERPSLAAFRRAAVWLLSLLLLAACETGNMGEKELVLTPLEAPALRQTLTSHTLSRTGGTLWQLWEYAGVHRDDGTMTGRVTWSGEEQLGQGTWALSPEGLYCRTWQNEWGGGKLGCFRASITPQAPTEESDAPALVAPRSIVFDHVSGSRGDAERYTYLLIPGNPYGL